MNISATLIVKDEAAVLARCLASIRDAVDEIVVVDTGSRDESVAIARRHADRVLHFAWIDDFSAARQYALDAARGDWLLWLDADDVVHGAARLRQLAAQAPAERYGYTLPYDVARDAWGNSLCRLRRERLLRRAGCRWQGRVHEVLLPPPGARFEAGDGVVVEHRPPPQRAAAKAGRNLRLLLRERAEGRDDARLHFYLGAEYAAAAQPAAAIAAYHACVARSAWGDEIVLALLATAVLHRQQQQWRAAEAADQDAAARYPQWPLPWFGLAATAYLRADWPAVVRYCERGHACPPLTTPHIVNPLDVCFNWLIHYTNALWHLGRRADALAWTRTALTICPDDRWHRHNYFLFAGATAPRLAPASLAPGAFHG
jgi:hypothetical protein